MIQNIQLGLNWDCNNSTMRILFLMIGKEVEVWNQGFSFIFGSEQNIK